MKTRLLLTSLFIVGFIMVADNCFAQFDSILQRADIELNDANFEEALIIYDDAAKAAKYKWEKSRVHYHKADCFVSMGDFESAAEQFGLAYKKNPKYDQEALFEQASYLRQSGDLAGAAKVAKKYIKKGESPELGHAMLEGMRLSEIWLAEPIIIKLEVDQLLSTPSREFAPTFVDEKKNVIMFTTNRDVEKGQNLATSRSAIYYASKASNGWSECVRLDSNVNKTGAEGVVSFDHDRGIIFFTSCNTKECGLRYSFLSGELAGESLPLVFENGVDENTTYGHPSYSQKLKVLFFASDMHGGFGGKDIWFSKYDAASDTWKTPVNLGPKINTAGDEMFPFIDEENILYFSSNGHPGMGGLDLLKWKFDESGSGAPENLKHPFNSNRDDFGIIFDNDGSGYLTSNRSGGFGSDDIYKFSPVDAGLSKKEEPSRSEIENALEGVSKLVNKNVCEKTPSQPALSALKVYPNPNDGNFNLELSASNKMEVLARIYSSTGSLAYQESNEIIDGKNTLRFELSSVPSGIYYIQFVSGCETLGFHKFIVK